MNRMRMMLKCLCVWMTAMAGVFPLSAQELNATVVVHHQSLQGSHAPLMTSLGEALRTFINGRRWSEQAGGSKDKIDCSFTLLVTEALTSGSFRGELYVQSHRSTGSSGRKTPMLNLRDREIEFAYAAYQPLTFDLHFVQDNLTATISYYVYLILGLAADADAPLGGTSYFRIMDQIAAGMQPYNLRGWDNDRNSRSRTVMSAAFNDGWGLEYRKMWYKYHSRGQDCLSVADSEGSKALSVNNRDELEQITATVEFLASLHKERPGSVLIPLFGDAKLDELILLLSNSNTMTKQQTYLALRAIYPARSGVIDKLRQ